MVCLPLLRLYHRLVQAHSISQRCVFHFLSNKWVILTWSLSPDRYAHVKYLEKAGSTVFTAGNRRLLAPVGHLSSLWQSRSTLKETSWRHLLCAEDPIAFRQHPLRGSLERFSAFFVFCLFSFYASEPRCLFKTHLHRKEGPAVWGAKTGKFHPAPQRLMILDRRAISLMAGCPECGKVL